VSHAPERKEKDCLNCGTIIHGRFCHVCGQENLEPKESFWQLLTHVFNDITHFDGKFFTTLKDHIFRPGFLSKQYMLGRRATYLNPVRMYVFTSAIFFLLFFAFFYSDNGSDFSQSTINGKTLTVIDKMDSTQFAEFTADINRSENKGARPMTRKEFRTYLDTTIFASGLRFGGINYRSKAQYDSVLASGQRKDSWLVRQFIYKAIDINETYHSDTKQMVKAFKSTLVHSFPQMLFISLPLLALILKLIYIRRKKFYYVSHGIFSMHLYIFLFIALLVLFSVAKLENYLHWGFLGTLMGFLIAGLFIYEYLAMKNFYEQGWIKTFIKFLLINFLFFIVIVLLFVVFILLSFFKI